MSGKLYVVGTPIGNLEDIIELSDFEKNEEVINESG